MPLIAYQVGSLPIFHALNGIDNSGVELQSARSWENPSTKYTGVSGSHTFLERGRSIAKPPKLSLKGAIVSDADNSADIGLSSLMAMGGKVFTPVIGFYYEESSPVDLKCCSNCATPLDWFITYGIITDIDRASELKKLETPYSLMYLDVKIDIEVATKWKRLTNWWWEFRSGKQRFINPYSQNNTQQTTDTLFIHPDNMTGLINNTNSYFFQWKHSDTQYNPLFWGQKYSNGQTGGLGADFQSFSRYTAYVDRRWSATPDSMYAFTGLQPIGSLTIEVTKQTGYFFEDSITESSILDLEQLDVDLDSAGYGGLRETDIIYAGYANPLPGFILRDNVRLTSIRPRWSYPSAFPGELAVGYNIVNTFTTSSDGRVAYLHDFGAY